MPLFNIGLQNKPKSFFFLAEAEGDAPLLIHEAPLLLVFALAYDDGKAIGIYDVAACVNDIAIHLEESFACLVDDETGGG